MRATALQRQGNAPPTGSTISRMTALYCRRPVRGQLDATMVSSQLQPIRRKGINVNIELTS
jgi:hypothetical protein